MTWIVFDFAGVVGRHQPDADKRALVARAGVPADAFWSAYWELRDRYDRADLTSGEYWSRVVRSAAGEPPDSATIEALVRLDVASWLHPNEPTLDVLARLGKKGHSMALLSNAPLELAAALDELPWLGALSPRLYSSRLGCCKPSPEAYRIAADMLGSAPQQCIFVDDRPVNVEGASAVGMTAVLFIGAAQLEHDLAAALRERQDKPKTA
jgi:putative hydrolase of the HAD superfamily